MINRYFYAVVFLLCFLSDGMAQKEITKLFKCTDYKIDKPNQETTKRVVFFFGTDHLLNKIEIYPCYSAPDVSYGNLVIEGEEINIFRKYTDDLNFLLSKYIEYIKIAKDNNIQKYSKYLDSLMVNKPVYSGSFNIGDKIYSDKYNFVNKIRMRHQLIISENRICIEIVTGKTKGIKVKGTSNHDFFYDDYGMNPFTYISFTSPEQFKSYIDAVNIEEAIREYNNPGYKYKDIDELFK